MSFAGTECSALSWKDVDICNGHVRSGNLRFFGGQSSPLEIRVRLVSFTGLQSRSSFRAHRKKEEDEDDK